MIISAKLSKTNHDTSCIQMITVQSGEGEQLSLRDIKETFSITSGDKQIL